MLTDGNYTDHGEHLKMYSIVESLSCSCEINIILYTNYNSIRNFLN